MASVVTICNRALGLLGDRANLISIDPPEGSAQADNCAQFWPMARDEALEAYDWLFASRTVEPSLLVAEAGQRWAYSYALPAECIAVRSMRRGDGFYALWQDRGPYFEVATRADGTLALYTDSPEVTVRFTRRVSDPNRYPPGFETAVIFLLASLLAGPVIKGRAGAQMAEVMRQRYERKLVDAALIDQNQRRTEVQYTPSNVRARGAIAHDQIFEAGQYRYSLPFWAVA